MFCVCVCFVKDIKAQSISLTSNAAIDFCSTNSVLEFTVDGFASGNFNGTFVLPADVAITNLTVVSPTQATVTGVTGLGTNDVGFTLNANGTLNEPVVLSLDIDLCDIFHLQQNGTYIGYNGAQPINRNITATINGTQQVNTNLSIGFPMLNMLQGSCNLVWDNTTNTFRRTIRIINNGIALDLAGAEIRFAEDFYTGNLTIGSVTTTGMVQVPGVTVAGGNVTIDALGLGACLPNTTPNTWDNSEVLEFVETIDGCGNYQSQIHVEYHCAGMDANEFCFGSININCENAFTPIPQLEVSGHGFVNPIDYCFGTGNSSRVFLEISHTANSTSAGLLTEVFLDLLLNFSSFDFTTLQFFSVSSLGVATQVFPTFSVPTIPGEHRIQFTTPVTIPLGERFRVEWDASIDCPPDNCGPNSIAKRYRIFWQGGCAGQQYDSDPFWFFNAFVMGGMVINEPDGDAQLIHSANAGTDFFEQVSTYNVVFPNTPGYDLWLGPNANSGGNRAYVIEFELCDALVFEHNVNNGTPGTPVNTAVGDIAQDIVMSLPGGGGFSLPLNNLPAGCTVNFTTPTLAGGTMVRLAIPFGTQLGGTTVNWNFLRGLTFDIDIRPHCGAGDPSCNMQVRFYYQINSNCNLTCDLPIGCTDLDVNVQCPGCIISGIYSNTLNTERYWADYGLTDADNNGLADNPAVSAALSPGNAVRRRTVMYGDRIVARYYGVVHLDNAGFLPFTFDNGVMTDFGIAMAGSANQTYYASHPDELGFDFAYIKMGMNNSDPLPGGNIFSEIMEAADGDNANDAHLRLTVTDGANVFTRTFDLNQLATNGLMWRNGTSATVTGGADEFIYDISISRINSAFPNTFPANFRYHDGVQIHAEFIYRVDRNVGVVGAPVGGYQETLHASSFGALRQVDITQPLTWPADRTEIVCPGTEFTDVSVLGDACNAWNGNPPICNTTASSPSGQLTNIDGCDDVQWGCQAGVSNIRVGGFDFDFSDFRDPLMKTCGVFFRAVDHNAEDNGDVLDLGRINNLAGGPNFFPFEYRHWVRKHDFDVTPVTSPTCSIQNEAFFLQMHLLRTTGVTGGGLYSYNLNGALQNPVMTCSNPPLPNAPFAFDYANADESGINNLNIGMRSPDDMQVWNDLMFFVSTPCSLSCNSMDFCVRQENDFNPDVTITGNASLYSTTPDISMGLQSNNMLQPPTPSTDENGDLLVTTPGHRLDQYTVTTLATVAPDIVWSTPVAPANPNGFNGTIEYWVQIENHSINGDAPNPWVAIHLPQFNVQDFWIGAEAEIVNATNSNTTLAGFVPACVQAPITLDLVGGYANYATEANFVNFNISFPLDMTAQTNNVNGDLVFRVPIAPNNPFTVLRRTRVSGGGVNNCQWEKSNMRVHITLEYDCNMVDDVLAAIAADLPNTLVYDALKPIVYAGYACDDDLDPSAVPIFDGFNGMLANMNPQPVAADNISEMFAEQSCGYVEQELDYSFVGTTVTCSANPSANTNLSCGEQAVFTWTNNSGPSDLVNIQLAVDAAIAGLIGNVVFTYPSNNGPTNVSVSYDLQTGTYNLSAALLPGVDLHLKPYESVTATITLPDCGQIKAGTVSFIQLSEPFCFPFDPAAFTTQTDYNFEANEEAGITFTMHPDCSLSATFTATGSCADDYEWHVDGQTITVTGSNVLDYTFSAIGTYTVSWQSDNCSATVDVNVVPTLDVTVTAQDEVCGLGNGEVNVVVNNGTANFDYDLSGISISGSPQNMANFTGLGAHTYQLTVIDATGCSYTQEIVIDNIANPVVSITTEEFTCSGALVLTASDGFDTYQWSSGETTQSMYETKDGSTFTVTATIGGSCTATASVTVTMPTMFQGNNVTIIGSQVNSYNTLSSLVTNLVLTPSSTTQMLVVYGTLEIDQTYTIESKNIWMGEGAAIIVTANSTLDINFHSALTPPTVNIQSVGECMWRGIVCDPSTGLRINTAHIEDAQYAVDLNHKMKFGCINTVFNRNYTGIHTANTSGNFVYSIAQDRFYGNTFECTAPIYSPYSGMTTDFPNEPSVAEIDETRWSWAGIFLNDVVSFTASDNSQAASEFRHVANGIWVNRTNLRVRNCLFNELPDANHPLAYINYNTYPPVISPPNYTSIFNGVAIYADGHNSDFRLRVLGNNPDNVNINACNFGVYVRRGMRPFIVNTFMSDMLNGVRVVNCAGRAIHVATNQISVNNNHPSPATGLNFTGISLTFCKGVNSNIEILENTISVDDAPNNRGIGIGVNDMVGTTDGDLTIEGNEIGVDEGVVGISLNGVGGVLNIDPNNNATSNTNVNLNRVYLNDAAKNRDGVTVMNSNGIRFTSNTVSGTGANAPVNAANHPRGFRLAASAGNSMECNRAYDLTTGYRFEGVCDMPDQFRTNDIGFDDGTAQHGNYIGIHVTNSNCQIGTQINQGNSWFGTYTGNANNFSAWNAVVPVTSPAFLNSTMYVADQTLSVPQRPMPLTSVEPFGNPDWINASIFGWLDCTAPPAALVSGGGNASSRMLSEFDTSVIFREYDPYMYADVNKWVAERNTYQKLAEISDSLSYGSLAYLFYDSLRNSRLADFAGVERKKYELQKIDSSLLAEKDLVQQNRDSLLGQIAAADSMLTNGLGDSTALSVERDSLLERLSVAQNNLDSIELIVRTAIADSAIIAEAFNANIVAIRYYEDYKQMSNSAYLRGRERGETEIGSATEAKLRMIAEKCFMEAGDAVFEARAMLSLIESRTYDDYDICFEVGYAMKKENEIEAHTPATAPIPFYYLYPNPAKNEVNFAVGNGWFNGEEIVITNALGQITALLEARSGNRLFFNTTSLANGVYNCRIKKGKETVSTQRFIVTR